MWCGCGFCFVVRQRHCCCSAMWRAAVYDSTSRATSNNTDKPQTARVATANFSSYQARARPSCHRACISKAQSRGWQRLLLGRYEDSLVVPAQCPLPPLPTDVVDAFPTDLPDAISLPLPPSDTVKSAVLLSEAAKAATMQQQPIPAAVITIAAPVAKAAQPATATPASPSKDPSTGAAKHRGSPLPRRQAPRCYASIYAGRLGGAAAATATATASSNNPSSPARLTLTSVKATLPEEAAGPGHTVKTYAAISSPTHEPSPQGHHVTQSPPEPSAATAAAGAQPAHDAPKPGSPCPPAS